MGLERSEIAQTYLSANEQANEFARTGLANLVLLNGGAVLAFAPIGAMFHVGMERVMLLAIGSLGSFILGLIAAAIAYLAGFFVNSKLSEMMQLSLSDPADSNIETARLSHNKTRYFGIVAEVVSALLFIFGSVLGAFAIYCGVPSNPVS